MSEIRFSQKIDLRKANEEVIISQWCMCVCVCACKCVCMCACVNASTLRDVITDRSTASDTDYTTGRRMKTEIGITPSFDLSMTGLHWESLNTPRIVCSHQSMFCYTERFWYSWKDHIFFFILICAKRQDSDTSWTDHVSTILLLFHWTFIVDYNCNY